VSRLPNAKRSAYAALERLLSHYTVKFPKREILNHLINWKKDSFRKPLLLRGARQVGKTSVVRQLGKTFSSFIELNFEEQSALSSFFEKNLDPKEIITDLQIFLRKNIIP
jgi:predicted AAA+ superfamily ATPase